jgi:steroid delta-isomerase-like uncharacterized protein
MSASGKRSSVLVKSERRQSYWLKDPFPPTALFKQYSFKYLKGKLTMSTENNKAVVRRFFEAFNAGDLDGLAAVCDPTIVVHNSGAPDPLNLEGFKGLAGAFLAAFPGGAHTIEDIIEAGDKVVTRVIYRGTHTGDLMGLPPTGKQVTVSAMTIDRLANGKIVETWRLFDQMGMMQQLGVIPAQA